MEPPAPVPEIVPEGKKEVPIPLTPAQQAIITALRKIGPCAAIIRLSDELELPYMLYDFAFDTNKKLRPIGKIAGREDLQDMLSIHASLHHVLKHKLECDVFPPSLRVHGLVTSEEHLRNVRSVLGKSKSSNVGKDFKNLRRVLWLNPAIPREACLGAYTETVRKWCIGETRQFLAYFSNPHKPDWWKPLPDVQIQRLRPTVCTDKTCALALSCPEIPTAATLAVLAKTIEVQPLSLSFLEGLPTEKDMLKNNASPWLNPPPAATTSVISKSLTASYSAEKVLARAAELFQEVKKEHEKNTALVEKVKKMSQENYMNQRRLKKLESIISQREKKSEGRWQKEQSRSLDAFDVPDNLLGGEPISFKKDKQKRKGRPRAQSVGGKRFRFDSNDSGDPGEIFPPFVQDGYPLPVYQEDCPFGALPALPTFGEKQKTSFFSGFPTEEEGFFIESDNEWSF